MKINNETLYRKALEEMKYLRDQASKLKQTIVKLEYDIFNYQSSYQYRTDRHLTEFSKRVEIAGVEYNCNKSILDKGDE